MGLPTQYGGYGYQAPTPTRPPATTWQQQQEYDAQDQYGKQAGSAYTDQANAGGQKTTDQSAAEKALSTYSSTSASPNTAAFRPLNLQGYSPTQTAQWQAAAAAAPSLSSRSSAAGAAGGSGALTAYKPSALEGFSSADVSGFDPTSYGDTFAQGANQELSTNLASQLHTLENQGESAGRLKTGFYTRDQGNVATRVATDLNTKLAEAATTFSGQKEQALESGAGMRLSAAQGIDANNLSRAQGIDANAITAGADADQYALAAGAQGLQGRQLGLEGAEYQDTQNYDRASQLDQMGQQGAEFQDTAANSRDATGLAARLQQEGMSMADYNAQAGRADAAASGSREWAATDRQTQDQRDVYNQQQALLRQRQNTAGLTPAYVDPSNAGRQLAAQLHIPYYG